MLPPREAQPCIGYVPVEADPHITAGLPMDTYELESCPISGFMISAHKTGSPDSFCWQVWSRLVTALLGPPSLWRCHGINAAAPCACAQVCSPSMRCEGTLEPYGYLRLKRQVTPDGSAHELATPTLSQLT